MGLACRPATWGSMIVSAVIRRSLAVVYTADIRYRRHEGAREPSGIRVLLGTTEWGARSCC
jgi:hypothetical protein